MARRENFIRLYSWGDVLMVILGDMLMVVLGRPVELTNNGLGLLTNFHAGDG